MEESCINVVDQERGYIFRLMSDYIKYNNVFNPIENRLVWSALGLKMIKWLGENSLLVNKVRRVKVSVYIQSDEPN